MGSEYGQVRYQRGIRTGSKTFSLIPPSVLLTKEELDKSNGNPDQIFYSIFSSYLAELEKCAGWVFDKGCDGGYIISYPTRVEYGYDGETSDIMREVLGDNFGTPGAGPFWEDHSPSSESLQGELESNDVDHASALLGIVNTTNRVNRQEVRIDSLERRITLVEHKVQILEAEKQ